MRLESFAVQARQLGNDFTAFFLKFLQFEPEGVVKAAYFLTIANMLNDLFIC